MGLSIGASIAVGAGLIALGGGSAVAYYEYKDYREKKDKENYFRKLKDMRGRRVTTRIYSQ